MLSVDGINAVTGQTAHPSLAGYVLEPWQSTQIDGWRKSLHDVARFQFTDLRASYAARTGRPQHVGVIGLAVFEEYLPPQRSRHSSAITGQAAAETEAGAAVANRAAPMADPGRQALGTAHGPRAWSPVSRTGFQRASSAPAQLTELRYDHAPRLRALGILPGFLQVLPHVTVPHAFPDGFVADPPAM